MFEEAINTGFQNSLGYLLDELKRTELKILLGAESAGPWDSCTGKENYPGRYALAEAIKGLTVPESFNRDIDESRLNELARLMHDSDLDIDKNKQESQNSGLHVPLYELQRLFSLSNFDMDVLLICLLPELNPDFQRYYAYLQDDITRKKPTVSMILRLLCANFEDTLTARHTFCPDAPLLKNNLVCLYPNNSQNDTPLLSRSVQVDERISDYLIGINRVDNHLQSFVRLCQPVGTIQDLVLSRDLKDRLLRLATRDKDFKPVYHFYGTTGAGKQTAAEAVCSALAIPLLVVDVKSLLAAEVPAEQCLSLVFREGLLQDAALYFNGSDPFFNIDSSDSHSQYHGNLTAEIEHYPHLVFLGSEKILELPHYPENRPFIALEFKPPTHPVRKQLWLKQTDNSIPLSADIDFDDLANKFRLTAGQIADAVALAHSLALWRDPENGMVTGDDLYLVCRQQSRQRLNTLTNQVDSRYNWDDIILPADQKEQLIEICNQVRYHHTVYTDWGFGRKLIRGKGLNALFAGPSGTGKTMAAEIMSNELGIDLYKIDLSVIISKYIGETEKNLDRIFREGKTANAIIFFDEADALFGKRSEVRDSHDRYANIEISYLLQKMEDYDGVIILATNLRKNMDEAFARRMHFAVEFPLPEEPDRYRIWQSMFPQEAPLSDDLDIGFLAKQFQITGGNIRNIALAAAFLAAQDSGLITMENIIRATKREYQKMGKLCTETDFARYFSLVKG
jgi:AAA+ superfamily predicted ATPase